MIIIFNILNQEINSFKNEIIIFHILSLKAKESSSNQFTLVIRGARGAVRFWAIFNTVLYSVV